MDEIDKANILVGCDSFDEAGDKEYFKEEFSTISLEAQFENELISEKDYDNAVKLRDLGIWV